jgi:spermidine synthase
LRFEQVKNIDLVDYNPDVLSLARTIFKPYNLGSLESEKVTVYIQEAFEFVSQLPDKYYHAIICDFTYPNHSEETKIYSREWFQKINRILAASGVICTNGVSPEKKTAGFWCLYQTLLSAELMAKPLQINIPSFHRHGYGNWGLFLASPQAIARDEIETIILPDNLQFLTHQQLLQAFVFESAIAEFRYQVMIHTLESPQLLFYLLNHTSQAENLALTSERYIDFLEIAEMTTGQIGESDALDLETVAKFWIENIYSDSETQGNLPDINRLLPVRHRYHSQKMTAAWLAHLNQLLVEIDGKRLLTSLLTRVQELPPQIASELQNLADKINIKQPLLKLPPHTTEFIVMLSVTLLMANLVAPDSVFAKGLHPSGGSGYADNDTSSDAKDFGLFLTVGGGFWLARLLFSLRDE